MVDLWVTANQTLSIQQGDEITVAVPVLADRTLRGEASRVLVAGDEEFLNFAGANYLALSGRMELKTAAVTAIDQHCGFSRLMHPCYGGSDPWFDAVEEAAAEFWGTEAALYLPSGFHLGFAALAGLRPLFDAIVFDEQAHWCLTQAAALAEVPVLRFNHCSADSLAETLDELPGGFRPLVATDGVFATTGRLPPLDCYQRLVDAHDGQMLVDESHAAGAVGPHGRGALDYFGICERAHVVTTLSKAFCAQGAVLLGNRETIDRSLATPAVRGSNQGSPVSAAISAAAINVLRSEPQLRHRLDENTRHLRSGLRSLGLEVEETPAPICAFTFGGFEVMREIQERLFSEHIYVLHSNYIASGPGGTIRLAVYADHTLDDLDRLLAALKRALSAVGW
jgi:7-keto-8-aminopelargonate synthetase-like enzyme